MILILMMMMMIMKMRIIIYLYKYAHMNININIPLWLDKFSPKLQNFYEVSHGIVKQFFSRIHFHSNRHI